MQVMQQAYTSPVHRPSWLLVDKVWRMCGVCPLVTADCVMCKGAGLQDLAQALQSTRVEGIQKSSPRLLVSGLLWFVTSAR